MNKFTAPTTKSIGKAMEISPPTTNPIRISGKKTKNVTTLKTPQVALKAKPIILPKIIKKNTIKSSDNIFSTILSNISNCRLMLADEYIICQPPINIYVDYSEKSRSILLFLQNKNSICVIQL